MQVKKRQGNLEPVSFDKILNRIKKLCEGTNTEKLLTIDPTIVSQKIVQELYDGVSTSELDELGSQIAIAMYSKNIDYKLLAGRIIISNLHKNTKDTFIEKIKLLYNHTINGIHKPLIAKYLYDLVIQNKDTIETTIDYSKDYMYDFFGFKTLEKNYLYKINKRIVERPQDMLMRVSLSIYRHDIKKALQNYLLMSNHLFTHATPTLYNAGSNREQFASCFLLTMEDDSIHGIYDTLKDCALISKNAGGIGLSVHNIRSAGSFIAGTNGYSNGLVPMLRVFNDTARYVDQGGNKRNGSFAIYLEPWHSDILEFLELKKNHGNELERARDLFYALWIPDLFMERVKNNEMWSLMCPNECKGLSDTHSEEFNQLYLQYESEKKYKQQIKARDIWSAILTSQIEVGMPYLLYKDSCNRKSNQQNLGTIRSSNLCTEIVEYSSPEETAVCNLASINLTQMIKYKDYNKYTLIIYSKPECVYCDLAKGYCKKNNINYEEKDYKQLTNISTEYPYKVKFPQIYIKQGLNQRYIGGYIDLEDYFRPEIDYDKLEMISKQLTNNLNHIIDYNYYPTEKTKRSNLRHRPIGIGVQGLANVFFILGIPFDSEMAKEINEDIFETIYYGAMTASMELSKERELLIKELGIDQFKQKYSILPEEYNLKEYLGSYSSFIGSPLSNGKFQFDLWGEKPTTRYNWSLLRKNIKLYGVRNSLLLAPMPTASTAQILGNYECFEPILSNIYTRRVLSGEYMVINDYLVKDLESLGIWNTELKDLLIKYDGSIQNIDKIPNILKERYKTIWELKQKDIIDMSIDRGKYICQSQSLNLFLQSPDISTLTSMHFYSWQKGLKTGIYYLRSRPSSKAIQFTISANTECENCSG